MFFYFRIIFEQCSKNFDDKIVGPKTFENEQIFLEIKSRTGKV